MNLLLRRLRPALLATAMLVLPTANATACDLQTCNAAVDVVITNAAPAIFQDISPSGGDATLVLRATTLITNAWYDAAAPYHGDAVGVYTRLPAQAAPPPGDDTLVNTALLYASYRVLQSLLPARDAQWRAMLADVGLDPDNDSTDPATDGPVAIGNLAGWGVVAGRLNDGMNQAGTEGGRDYNPLPFADYTGYRPVNTPDLFLWPSRWQPDIQRQGIGLYKSQVFVTPQYAYVEPYSYDDPQDYYIPPPRDSRLLPFRRYKAQADEVLEASANLDESRKLKSELFDDKIRSLGFSAVFAAQTQGLSLWEFIQLDFLTNMAAFDAGIVIWQWKRTYDAVRPFSAIRLIYGNQPVTAWGGPGQGTVGDLPGNEWKSYLEEADHPEYPSASACFCAAHAQSARRFLPQGDDLAVPMGPPGFPTDFPMGSSKVEPGVTPAADTTLFYGSWSDFETDCGESRVWAGVHFRAAVEASRELCSVFGDQAYDYLQSLLDGTAPERGPSVGRYDP